MGDCSCIEGTNYSLGNISGREEGCVTQQFTSRALVKEGGGADCVNALWKTSLWVGYVRSVTYLCLLPLKMSPGIS